MIPWTSPVAQYRAHRAEVDAAIARVLDNGAYVLGDEVEAFEEVFARFCGSRHAVGVGNGTDALILSLRALGVGAGDEVITVSHTALATVAAVLAANATPVLVEVDPVFYTIDPAALESAITSATKAIVAVHLYGQAVDLNAVKSIADRHGLILIEDCAQAAGASYRGRRVGGIGHVGCFSFYPTKNLGAIGDAGMVVTNDAAVAEGVRRLRQYGWNGRRETHAIGVNSRLDPIQAAILNVKLPHLPSDNERRAAIAARYGKALAGCELDLPMVRPDTEHAFHLYVVKCDGRDRLQSDLAAHGVGTSVHYPVPAHLHGGYAERVVVPRSGLPISEGLAKTVLSLPLFPELDDGDIDRVIEGVLLCRGRTRRR